MALSTWLVWCDGRRVVQPSSWSSGSLARGRSTFRRSGSAAYSHPAGLAAWRMGRRASLAMIAGRTLRPVHLGASRRGLPSYRTTPRGLRR